MLLSNMEDVINDFKRGKLMEQKAIDTNFRLTSHVQVP